MNALLVTLACLQAAPMTAEDDVVPLVEISSNGAEEGEGVTPREIQALEDAVALAFNSDRLHVETRRQRLSRTPPQVYWHQEALQACARPRWPKGRVVKCIKDITFPNPPLKAPRLLRATHLLRISRALNPDGEILALSLNQLGKNSAETVAKRQLDKTANPTDRRAAALDMATELLGPLRP
jgi:hypothetical protein